MSIAEIEAREIQLDAPSGLWSEAWQRLRRNPGALVGFGLVGFFLVTGGLGWLLVRGGNDERWHQQARVGSAS